MIWFAGAVLLFGVFSAVVGGWTRSHLWLATSLLCIFFTLSLLINDVVVMGKVLNWLIGVVGTQRGMTV